MDSYRFVGQESGLKKIRFVSWITNPNLKRFGWYRDHESSHFSKDLTCFHKSNESSRILSTMAQNKSLKLEIRESESLRILKLRIRESGFANPNLKDLYRGFVSEKKIPKLLDLYTNPASLQNLQNRGANSKFSFFKDFIENFSFVLNAVALIKFECRQCHLCSEPES
jgi:hypothetical protein